MSDLNVTPLVLPYDETGALPENFIQNEECDLAQMNVRAWVAKNGSFFVSTFVMRDANGKTVDPSSYEFGLYSEILSPKIGQEIAAAVIVTDPNVVAPVYIDYHAVGGPWAVSNQIILSLFNQLNGDDRPVSWPNILGKPTQYVPAHHFQDIGDLFGAEYLVAALERFTNAMLMGDNASNDQLWKHIDDVNTALQTQIDAMVSTKESNTISWSGDGKKSALIANVKIDPIAGNRIKISPNGISVIDAAPPNLAAQYVDSVNGNDGNDGSYASPLRSVITAWNRIVASGGVGSYTIYLMAGQWHNCDQQVAGLFEANVVFSIYGDALCPDPGKPQQPPGYWWSFEPSLNRPVLNFPSIPVVVAGGTYTVCTRFEAKSLWLQGIAVNQPPTLNSLAGFDYYLFSTESSGGRIWLSGSDFYFNTAIQQICRGGSVIVQNCNLINFIISNGGGGNYVGNIVPSWTIDQPNSFAVLYHGGNGWPDFWGRSTNFWNVIRPWNLCSNASYNAATRQMLGTMINKDMFSY